MILPIGNDDRNIDSKRNTLVTITQGYSFTNDINQTLKFQHSKRNRKKQSRRKRKAVKRSEESESAVERSVYALI